MRMTAIVAAFLAGLSSTAMAQTAAERVACRGDFNKLCAGTRPGGGRALACLGKQKDKLSEACRKVVEAHGQ
jgi:hypothetical protein